MSQASARGSESDLTWSQRRSVLRIAALALALTLALPLYYALVAVVPAVETVAPPFLARAAMAAGLCLGFPAVFVSAHVLARRDGEGASRRIPEYGVDDRWERQNL
ncbi:MAG: hypothetical protein ABEJ89_01650 [Haloarculaceae archaeon]